MPLVAMQCKNCGGTLQVDTSAESYYCPHCLTTYKMEQAVTQNFQTTHIETQNMIDDGSGKIDQAIQSGEAFLSLRKYKEARITFLNLTSHYAHKYRAWWGLARAITEDFTAPPRGKKDFICVCDAMQSAIQQAPIHKREELEQTEMLYCSQWQNYCDQLTAKRSQQLEDIDNRTKEFMEPKTKELTEMEFKIESKTLKLNKLDRLSRKVPIISFVIVFAIIFILSIMGTNDIIYTFIASLILCGIIIYLPVRVGFFLVCKATRVTTEMLVKNLDTKIQKIQSEIVAQTNIFNQERSEVIADTIWLDK